VAQATDNWKRSLDKFCIPLEAESPIWKTMNVSTKISLLLIVFYLLSACQDNALPQPSAEAIALAKEENEQAFTAAMQKQK